MTILLALLAILPLAVNFWVELPYEPIKILLIEMLAAVSCAAAFVWVFLNKKNRSKTSVVERLGWVDFAVAVWFIILALSTVQSDSPYMSFWSSDVRGTGLAYYAALTALYFIVRFGARTKDWLVFSRISCVVAILVSVYGFLQWLGLDFDGLERAFPLYGRTGPTRAFATLGHPNFLGTYLALFAPFGVYVWLKDSRKVWRFLGGLAVASSAIAVTLTYSRGAWLAYLGGLAVVWFLWEQGRFRKSKKIILGFGLLLLIATGLFVAVYPRLLKSDNSFVYRIASSFDFRQGSTLARVSEWKYALGLILQRPILGYGMDTYVNHAINRTKDPLERNRDWQEADPSVADRLHNLFFDIAWSSGLVGLAAFFFLLATVLQRLRKVFKQRTELRHWMVALSGTLFAYLLSNLTGFDFSASGLWFYLVLAGIVGSEYHQNSYNSA
ncbi:O-antigen ligase family protein [Candidatus Uhrbacteria bacterium]|nr:O-antigen ligase family protein [Candidatus Uhrbacteria bacterium]